MPHIRKIVNHHGVYVVTIPKDLIRLFHLKYGDYLIFLVNKGHHIEFFKVDPTRRPDLFEDYEEELIYEPVKIQVGPNTDKLNR